MSSKFRRIQVKNNDSINKKLTKRKTEDIRPSILNTSKMMEKFDSKNVSSERKSQKAYKTLVIDEKRVKKNNKNLPKSNDDDDSPKQFRARSQAKRKINKNKDLDNPKKNSSSSYEKRNINNKNGIQKKEVDKESIKTKNKNEKVKKEVKKEKKINNDDDNELNYTKIKKPIKKSITEIPKETKTKKIKDKTKKIENARKNHKNEKNDKKSITIDLGTNNKKKEKVNNEEKTQKIKKTNGKKKVLANKERTTTSKFLKNKSKQNEEENNENEDEEKDKANKRKKVIGKSVDKVNNKKAINNKIKKALVAKKIVKKKEESESSSSDSGSDSGSESDSKSSKSNKSEKSKNSKRSKSSQSSKSSESRNSSKDSKSSKNSKKREASSSSSYTPTSSISGNTSEDEDEKKEEKEKDKKTEIKNDEKRKPMNKSKTQEINNNVKNGQEEKKSQDKKNSKVEEQQILNNIPKLENNRPPLKDGRKGSIIVGSTYLRRRSMDNPLTRERLELLVNQMTLKQNGGNTLFLKNYENGPSYRKEITLITKDNQSIKKKLKINECTKAGCSGPGIVKTNQDAYFVKENFLKNNEYFYIGVCDGHGEAGHVISNFVTNKLPVYITDLSNETIINAFKKVNKEIYANSKMDSNMSGTTVVSIILTPNNIICVNLGDSRAALFKYDNGIYYCKNLSRDHKPCEADESRRIMNNGGRIKKCYDEDHKRYIGPDRVWLKNKEEPGLAMTRSLGDKIAHNIGVIDEPEFKSFTYDGTEKFIIIASDGLWEYVSGDQCISIVKPFYEDNMDSKEAALALTKEAFRRWKRKEVAIDDITVVIIFFE